MRALLTVITIALVPSGCIDVPWADGAEAPSAVPLEAFPPDATLTDGLDLIRAELDSAIATGMQADAVARMMRVEALTDRILETEMPFGWLATANYSVEARVWQIQARADRIVARLRAGVRREDVLTEVSALRDDVASLRGALAGAGEAPPVPLERLLQRLDSATRQRPDTLR